MTEIHKENVGSHEDVVFFIGVHVGAGYHAEENSPLYKKSMKQALSVAHDVIVSNPKSSALDVVEAAIASLELDPLTNAGVGANLTLEGTVECDASIMDGKNTAWFGAVGAVSGIKNPVKIARKIVDQRKDGLLSLGRVPPMILVGEGAHKFGEVSGVPVCSPSELVTEKSKQAWQKYSVMIQNHSNNVSIEQQEAKAAQVEQQGPRTDSPMDPDTIIPTTKIFVPNLTFVPPAPHAELPPPTLPIPTQVQTLPPVSAILAQTPLPVIAPSTTAPIFPVNTDTVPAIPVNNNILPPMSAAIPPNEVPTIPVNINAIPSIPVAIPPNEIPTQNPEPQGTKRRRLQDDGGGDTLYDTVGAVCMMWRKCGCKVSKEWCDCGHSIASGVSSGGILMKFPGRIGEAALYGCGCWAQQNGVSPSSQSTPVPMPLGVPQPAKDTGKSKLSVACSTTGTGEQIMQSLLARNCAHCLFDTDMYADDAIKTAFESFLKHQDLQLEKFGGLLGCQTHIDEGVLNVEGVWAHTTESMAVGYYVSGQNSPKTFISRLPTSQTLEVVKPPEPGLCVSISSANFSFNCPS